MLSHAKRANVIIRFEKFNWYGRTEQGQQVLNHSGHTPEKLDAGMVLVDNYKRSCHEYDHLIRSVETDASNRDMTFSAAQRSISSLRQDMDLAFRGNKALLNLFSRTTNYRNVTVTREVQGETGIEEDGSILDNQNEPVSDNPFVSPLEPPETETLVIRQASRSTELLAEKLVYWPWLIEKVEGLDPSDLELLANLGWTPERLTVLKDRINSYKLAYMTWTTHRDEAGDLHDSRELAWSTFYNWFLVAAMTTRTNIREYLPEQEEKLKRAFGIQGELSLIL